MRRALSETGNPASLPAAPVSISDFTALAAPFAPFPENYRFALAVSGGPDSMTLAHCAKLWADANKSTLHAFIVDHGLRAESAFEAEETRKRLESIGVSAEILRWEHAPVVTKLHATARKARYRILADACTRHGIRDLWLAHHRDDQAETILMRLAKGSGIDGIAGMSAESAFEHLRLLRPFLTLPKERLVATCRAAGLDFIEDASNRSDKFARGRLRRVMPLLADEGLTMERLIDLGARAADARDALDHYTHEFMRDAASRDEVGVVRITLDSLRAAPREIAGRALALCLRAVHPESYGAEHASLTRLLDALRSDDEMTPRTLHGCLVSKTPAQITVMREIFGITDALMINPGESVMWDERWRVSLDKNAASAFTIRPLGSPAHETLDTLAPGLRKFVPQGRARASLPALWQSEKLVLIPSLKGEGTARAELVSAWPPP